MKKLANLIALFILVSVNVLTSVSYAQEVDGEPLFEGEGYFIDGIGDDSSDDELPFSDKKEDVSDEDIVDLPEVVEDTLPSLIDMVVDTVDEHTGEDGDKGIDEGLGENEGGNFTEGDNFEGVETERQAVIDDFSEEVENLEDSLSALDLLNLSIEPEIEIMGTCDEGEIYVPELDTCATRDEEEIVYYWTDENGRGVISIKDPDGDTFLTMMDMNLGATKSGYTNNENIRGYYYQWGNNQGVRSVASVNPSNNPTLFSTDTVDYQNYWPGHQYSGLFVYGDDVPDYWNNVSIGGIDQENFDGLWGGLGDLGDTTSIDTFWGGIKNGDTRQGPCPDGYHVPSMGEWNALITYWYNTKNTDKKSYTELNTFDDSSFRTAFLLPLAGYRKYKDSEIGSNSQGDYGRYRSSSPYGSTLYNANFLAIRSEGVYKAQTNSYARGFGASIRCFKDSSEDVETLTITFDGNGGELLGADSEGRLGQKVALGKKAQRPVDPEMEGLDFMGWFEEGSSIEYDFEELVTMGTVLYAKRDVNCDDGEEYVESENKCYPSRAIIRDSVTNEIIQINDMVWNDLELYFLGDDDTDVPHFTIMDRNMGATEVYNQQFVEDASVINTASFGYHYQWGNNYGFEPCISLGGQCSDFPNNGGFISTIPYDTWSVYMPSKYARNTWSTSSNWMAGATTGDNIWGGGGDTTQSNNDNTLIGNNNDWSILSGRQGPCPDDYYIPSTYDWTTLKNVWGNSVSNSSNGIQFVSDLLLPLAGQRTNAGVSLQGTLGLYWSSTPFSGNEALGLAFHSSVVNSLINRGRSNGYSVRCVKSFPNTSTLTLHANGGSKAVVAFTGTVGDGKFTALGTPTRGSDIFEGWYDAQVGGNKVEIGSDVVSDLYARWGKDCDDGEEYVESEDKCYPSRAIIRDSETNEIIQINDMEWGDLNFYFVSDTGRVSHYAMMDRDIGATSNDINNSSSYGYYYQWGNNYGFSKNGTYETTGGAIDVSDKGPGNYYTSKILMSTGYLTNNENMWGGVGDTTGANGAGTYLERQGPCPDGYYIPSTYDWNEMYEDWEPLSINGKEEWKSDLLLPALGGMNPDGEVLSIYKEGDFGGFWSSSIYELDKTQSHDMSFDFKDNGLYIQGKIEPMQGRAIRCFKNITPDDSMLVDVDGGKNAKIYVNSGVITKLISPSREGYTFMGWYSNPTFTLTVNENDDAPSSIYAYWLKNNTVTFISKRGPKVEPQQVVSGNTLVEPAIADFPGYDFEGWYSDEGLTQEYDFDTPVTEDITLYAKWSDYIYDYNNLNLYFISDTGEKYHYTLMDRNLGATSNDINNSSSYGYYYQWGNNYGFSGSTMVYNGSVDASSYGPNNYYNVGRFMVDGNNGWDSSDNRNLWGGVGDTTGVNGVGTYLDRQGPCPDGYYIPSVYNFAEIKTNWESSSTDKSGDGFSSDILLPKSGRINGNGGLEGLGQNGYIWSSSSVPGQLRSYFIHYAGGNLSLSDSFRQFGRPIRCFKNTLDTDSLNKDNIYMNGGTTAVISVNGDEIVSLGTPLKANSVFKGWFFESNFQTEASEGDVITSSTSLYAKWECKSGYIQESGECLKSNSITFDSNGGTDVLGQTIKEGLSAERPKNPRKSGFIFDGWYEDPNFEGEEYDFNLPLTGDITLYAKWLDNGFELKDNGLYQSEDGYYIIDVDDSDYPQGCNTPGLPNPDRYCILSMPSAGGYAPYSGTIFVAPALSDIPISGGGAVDYCDNLTMGGLIWRIPGSHAGNWSSMYNNRDKLINFTAQGSEKPGHYWANNNASIPYQNCTVDGGGCGNESDSNKVLAVRCVSWNAYEVMFETNGGSVVKSRGVPINSKIIEPKSELLGYTLKGWYSDEQLAQRWNFEENRVNNDLILYAKRHVNTYTITFDMDGGTGVLIITGDYNSPIEAPSDPVKEGYTFIGWSQPIPPTMPAGDMTIKALWEINQYTITFDMDGGTGVLIITGDYNSPIEAPSDPVKEGYTFIGWSQPIPPSMPAGDLTIKALWKKNGGNWSGRGKVDLGDKNDEHGSAEDTDKSSSKGNSCLDCNQEVFDAHKWAYEHGLTQYKNISEARMDDYLNRSEMAKISSIFATDFLGREPNEGKQKFCSHYSDLWKVDAEMKFFIIQSCELGYMGYMANGVDVLQRFRPYTPISLAETSIILSRIVRGNKYAVSENKWYQGHLYAVYENGLIDDISKPFDNITRKDAYTMLYRLNSLINN